jgi:UDP-MurNAc hydroxylase
MPTIEWINHASYLMDLPELALLCDPWFEGTAFKDGWAHITPTAFTYDRFGEVSHIWISHQHPDHFAPTTLKKIPAADRARVVVLYQETDDKLVVNWLRSNGFSNAREVPLRRWLKLTPDIEIQVGTLSDDSWLALRHNGKTYLNVNDCVLKRRELIESIAEAIGKVDILFTQFSYAQWVGNPKDSELRRKDALEKYDRIRLQDEIFKPRIIIPFASYIYFCHEENFFMNDGVNAVCDIAEFIEARLGKRTVVLYPGETWNIEESVHDWRPSAERYRADFAERVKAGPIRYVNPVVRGEALASMNGFLQRLTRKNPLVHMLLRGRKATFYATDVGQAYEVTTNGVRVASLGETECDLNTAMENVLYAFRTPWGGNTLHVSARFVSYVTGGHLRFFHLMHELHHYNVTPINFQWIQAQGARALRGIARRLSPRPARPRARVG